MNVSRLASQVSIQTKGSNMDNKYMFAVVGGVFLFLWFWVGIQPYYAAEGGSIETLFLFTAFLVLALGGGDSEGSDLISVLTSSIKGFIPKFNGLTIAYVVGRGMIEALMSADGFDPMGIVESVAFLFASGVVIILAVACLKKSS